MYVLDLSFGGAFTLIKFYITTTVKKRYAERNEMAPRYLEGVAAFIASGFGTLFSAPFNYARNIQYATPPNVPHPSSRRAINNLLRSGYKKYPQDGLFTRNSRNRVRYIAKRLRVGWGSARVKKKKIKLQMMICAKY
jgi:hypothetical protein